MKLSTTNQKKNSRNTDQKIFGNPEDITYMLWTRYRKEVTARRQRGFYIRLVLILILFNLLFIAGTFAQLVQVNGVEVKNTSQITIKGDFGAGAGASVANNGIIDMTGNFTNNSGTPLFGLSGGTVVLNGTNQTIGGSNPTDFNNLNLQGSGTKTLEQDALVGGNNGINNGVLMLGGQRLNLNSNELTVNNSSPGAVTRFTGFIISETDAIAGYGSVKWMAGENTGNYVIPFGSSASGHYLPVIMNITNAGNGNGYIKAATYPTNTTASPNNRPLPTGLTTLLSNFGSENASNTIDRWWMLDVQGYNSQPISDLTFTYRDSEWDNANGSTNTIFENSLKAQSNDYNVWSPVTMGVVNTSTNSVTITGINNYNPLWTLVSNTTPLPLTLLDFDAKLNEQEEVDLTWVTATEINNDFFTVEKSANGKDFEPFGFVDGAGNSSSVLYYQTVDLYPYENISYYRLKQTDFDGQFSYSEIKAVRREKAEAPMFSVFPNPATDVFYVKFDLAAGNLAFFILDMNGRVIREISTDGNSRIAEGVVQVDRLDLAPGMYFVTRSDGKAQKIVMQ